MKRRPTADSSDSSSSESEDEGLVKKRKAMQAAKARKSQARTESDSDSSSEDETYAKRLAKKKIARKEVHLLLADMGAEARVMMIMTMMTMMMMMMMNLSSEILWLAQAVVVKARRCRGYHPSVR